MVGLGRARSEAEICDAVLGCSSWYSVTGGSGGGDGIATIGGDGPEAGALACSSTSVASSGGSAFASCALGGRVAGLLGRRIVGGPGPETGVQARGRGGGSFPAAR